MWIPSTPKIPNASHWRLPTLARWSEFVPSWIRVRLACGGHVPRIARSVKGVESKKHDPGSPPRRIASSREEPASAHPSPTTLQSALGWGKDPNPNPLAPVSVVRIPTEVHMRASGEGGTSRRSVPRTPRPRPIEAASPRSASWRSRIRIRPEVSREEEAEEWLIRQAHNDKAAS